MLGENKNIKDTSGSIKDSKNTSVSLAPSWRDNYLSYTKTNKLITALYMVTDTMEKEEPIRFKLRTLGIEVLSDSYSFKKDTINNLKDKINSILSFLNIASDVHMISEMNFNILRKEFLELKRSIEESITKDGLWLEEFIKNSVRSNDEEKLTSSIFQTFPAISANDIPKGQGTRLGVQKGSTLLKALDKVRNSSSVLYKPETKENFEVLKNKRREEIISIIKNKKNINENGLPTEPGATITDIKNEAISSPIYKTGVLISCGDKTLQRELVSMVKDNVLKKTGDKRWSRYSIK